MGETNVDKIATTGGVRSGSADLAEAELEMLDGITAGTSLANKAAVLGANKNLDVLALPVSGLKIGAGAGTAVDCTAAELNRLSGVTAGTAAASKGVVLDANKDVTALRDLDLRQVKTTGNVGTANTGTTATEYGDGHNHKTVLTVNTTLPAIAGGADLAVGKLLYTFPAGAIIIESAYMSLAITQSQGNITADTPDGGLGTVIGSGAVATLDGTATFENILTGQTFNDCNGTAEVKTAIPTAGVPLVIEAGAAHTVHFNVADGWAASGDAAASLAGTVVLNWRFVN
jgi:hypothetical protein